CVPTRSRLAAPTNSSLACPFRSNRQNLHSTRFGATANAGLQRMLDAVRSLTMNLIDGQLTETAWQSAAINPSGARYDGLINPGGEDINSDWDAIWEAATARLTT